MRISAQRGSSTWKGSTRAMFLAASLLSARAFGQGDVAANPSSTQSQVPPAVAAIAYPTIDSDVSDAPRRLGFISVDAEETYDDNILPGSLVKSADYFTRVTPSVTLQESGGTSNLSVRYAPTVQVYRRYDALNNVGHNLGADYKRRLSQRWTVTFGENFGYVPQAQALIYPQSTGTAVDPLAAPLAQAVYPEATMTSNTNYSDIQYRWSARSYADVSGTYQLRRFDMPGLISSDNVSGRATYNYRYSPHWTVGGIYQFERFWFGGGTGRTQSQSAMLAAEYTRGQNLDLTFSVGPNFTRFDGQQVTVTFSDTGAVDTIRTPLTDSPLGVTGTARLTYRAKNADFSLNYSQGANNGGGVTGSSKSNSYGGAVRLKLSRHGTLTLDEQYVQNRIDGAISTLPFDNLSYSASSAGYEYPLGRSASITLRYRHFQQDGGAGSLLAVRRNQISVGVQVSPRLLRIGK